MPEYIMNLKNVSVSYGYGSILENINLGLKMGESVGITGKSGKGKTSLLNVCAGLVIPSEGCVEIKYKRASFVFQDHRLFPWKSVLENIILPVKERMPMHSAEEKAGKYMRLLEIDDAYDLKPSQISGGMAQRASIARALVNDPDIIFMDEPFSSLDEQMRRKTVGIVKTYCEETGCSMMLATHYMEELCMCSSVFSV